jgi:hypothetical protein
MSAPAEKVRSIATTGVLDGTFYFCIVLDIHGEEA